MGNQLATTEWLMLRPVISLKGELNEFFNSAHYQNHGHHRN